MRTALMTLLLGVGLCAPAVAQPACPALIAQVSPSFTARVKQLDAASAAVGRAASPNAKALASLARLNALQAALTAIPVGGKPEPRFLAKYKNEIVYHEPAGQWLVRADQYWKLRDTYAAQPAAEAIAWAAASQPLPGECETDASCILTLEKRTNGRYLELYPKGKHADAAMRRLSTRLAYLANDKQDVYQYPAEAKNEIAADLDSLRKAAAAATSSSKDKVLKQLDEIGRRASK